MEFVTLFAENSSSGLGVIFPMLGIDWRAMLFQLIAFGILLFILAKFVYPPILAMLDRRDKTIKDSLKAAEAQSKKSAAAAEEVAKQLAEARNQADEILAAAKNQSQEILDKADADAAARGERILAAAREQIGRDAAAAREMLRNEAVELIALATQKVVCGQMTAKIDENLVAEAIAEVSGNQQNSAQNRENSENPENRTRKAAKNQRKGAK